MPDHERNVAELLAVSQNEPNRALAARYAPVICFDAQEPFLPLAVGYTIFREDGDSPSFPRRVLLDPAGEPAPPEEAARFAAAVTTFKQGQPGPWRGTLDDMATVLACR